MTITKIKEQFPLFKNHPSLVYLDSAATSQKPLSVIDRIKEFYEKENANVHRGIYDLSETATESYERARTAVAQFIGASRAQEIVFTKSATEAINLVSSTLRMNKGDEIVITEMEHHSNLVPWQERKRKGRLKLHVIPISENGLLNLQSLPSFINKKTKIVAFAYISNVLGTINPVKEIVQTIKEINPKTLVLVDAAQAVPHMPVSVEKLGCDFFVFSGHKMMGPTGIGVLWAKQEILEELEPYQYGGSMISRVSFKKSAWAEVPYKFEAGTQHIAGAVGLREAVLFLEKIGMENICKYEEELTAYALQKLLETDGVTIYGPRTTTPCGCEQEKCSGCKSNATACKNRLGILSLSIQGVHAHDVAELLNEQHIAVRAGHHCAMPLHQRLGVPSTVRASLYVYNNHEDIDRLIQGIEKVKKIFKFNV